MSSLMPIFLFILGKIWPTIFLLIPKLPFKKFLAEAWLWHPKYDIFHISPILFEINTLPNNI